jgi:hypothetical protein
LAVPFQPRATSTIDVSKTTRSNTEIMALSYFSLTLQVKV